MNSKEFLEENTVSYWESHQFENALTEDGEYIDIYDAIEYAKMYHEEQVKNSVVLADVSQQRELLVAMFKKMTQPQITMLEIGDYEKLADELLSNL